MSFGTIGPKKAANCSKTVQLPMVQEVTCAMQIQGQKLVSKKGAVQTQTAVQTAIQVQAVIEI